MELKITPSIKNVDTMKAPFFEDNKLLYSDSCPVSGQHKVGDIVISSIQADNIIGWICIEAGEPGVWSVIENTNNIDSGGYATKSEVEEIRKMINDTSEEMVNLLNDITDSL